MRFGRWCKGIVAAVACGHWVLGWPVMSVAADPASGSPRQSLVQDVALGPGSNLIGRVIDAGGRPAAGQRVTVIQRGLVRQAVTDAAGRFVIEHMAAGPCQVTAGSSAAVVRCWTPDAAPPAAGQGVLLVQQGDIQRGQQPISALTTPLLIGAVIAAAIAIPIAVHNAHKDSPSGS